MATKSKASKKQAQAKRAKGRFNDGLLANTMQAPSAPSLPNALKAFDSALTKVTSLRAVLHGKEDCEVVAHRCQRLSNLAADLSMAAHTLNAAAYAKAEQG